MTYRPLILIGLSTTLGLGCGDDKGSSAGSTGDDTTSATTTTTATSDATTDATTSATTDATTATTTTTTTGDPTSATTTDPTTTTSGTSTTGDPVCDLVEAVCDAAEAAGPFLDCGVIDPWNNSLEEWQDAQACALAAVESEKAFKLITWLQGIDSEVGYGYLGFEGESYGVLRYFYDSYPPEWLSTTGCGALIATPDCVVEPGEPCLSCDEPTPQTVICGGE